MNELERQFLSKLATMPKGRCAYGIEAFERALPKLQRLVDEGYIRERRITRDNGFQILSRGREYLAGVSE